MISILLIIDLPPSVSAAMDDGSFVLGQPGVPLRLAPDASSACHPLLYSVAMLSDTEGWAVGSDGMIFRWDGNSWISTLSPTIKTLNSVSVLSATDAWAVGETGTILHWDGSIWTASSHSYTTPLHR
jgi:photosystem II stability/assembly factor-like uncharacterized protein